MTAPDGGPVRAGPHTEPLDTELELAKLRADVDTLSDRVADLADTLSEETSTSGPKWPDWTVMDRQQAERAWTGLWAWLRDYLAPTYVLTRAELPDCWPRHNGMRDELSWLWGTHRAVYSSSGGPTVVASWHLTYRDGVLRNVAALAGRLHCSPGKCRGERTTDTLPAEGDPTRAELWFDDGINADLERRNPPDV